MRMSFDGRKRLMLREGTKLHAYKDSVGVWTIGVGHTSAAGPPSVIPGLTITSQECDAILSRDLVQYENAVNQAIKVPISQRQFDACVSLCFNIGTGGFARSTVVKRVNQGDFAGAADAFLMWNKPPEIMERRRSERAQFLEPNGGVPPPPDIPKPISPTTPQQQSAKKGIAALVVAAGLWITATVQQHPVIIGGGVFVLLLMAAGWLLIRKRN